MAGDVSVELRGRRPKPKAGGRAAAAKRANMRNAELRALHRYCAPANFLLWDAFFAEICRRLGTDPLAADVTAQELGVVLKLTLKRKMEIEDKATAAGRNKGWTRRNGKPYLFRICTIAPHDVSPEEAQRKYKQRSNATLAAQRKADRAEKLSKEKTMSMQLPTYDSYAEALAAQKANTRAQTDALYVAIGDGECTVSELMMAVRKHPAWRGYFDDTAKFRQAVVDRLHILRSKGRITDRYEPRPQGGILRLIRRSI